MTLFDKDQDPLTLVIDVSNAWGRIFEKGLQPWGLSVAQYRILEYVSRSPGKITPSQLAALLVQESHSVSGLLNRLEDRDIITRVRDRVDRRVVWVDLTTDGWTMFKHAQEKAAATRAEFSRLLSLMTVDHVDVVCEPLQQVFGVGVDMVGNLSRRADALRTLERGRERAFAAL